MEEKSFLKRINPAPKILGDSPKDTAIAKKKIIFYGDSPTCATGFGQVSRNILPALHKTGRYDIDILGINYWGDPHDYPFKIWPMAVNPDRDPYGRKRLHQHLMDPNLKYDFLFFLQDTFIVDFLPDLLGQLKKAGKDFKSVYYFPIDGIPKKAWIEAANAVDFPVTYSEFGKQQSVAAVPGIEDRLQIIPHGVNPKVFFPVPRDKVESFKTQYFGKLSNKFIVTNVNRNQQRKDIPATIRAFIELKKQRPESILYLHMAPVDQGWNLPEVIKSFGLDIKKDVILPQNFTPSVGFPLEILNLIYNASDCIVSTTVGEGWGLSWTEAMATKTPVVYPINTCLGEYITNETGFPFKSGEDMDHLAVITNDNEVLRPTAHIYDLVKQLIYVYDNREEALRRAETAYKMVHNTLIWDKQINPRWVKLFDEAESKVRELNILSSSAGTQTLKGDLL